MTEDDYKASQDRVALEDLTFGHRAFVPPRRVPISQAAAENLVVNQPSMPIGPWSAESTPYMVEPMDMLASRKHEALVFVGPARTGKTLGLLLGWMANNIVNDPGDMLFVQMTQDKAREFSKTDIKRSLTSPKLAEMLGSRHDDAIHDKMFRNGMWLRIGWPTQSNVAGSTYRYVGITDLDRMPNRDDVDGEGPLFDLALKRTQTFMSRGMCLVESSPGVPLTDPFWRPATPHEAPPAGGILSLYNRSDRRRYYWQCTNCREYFEAAPGLKLFGLPDEETLIEIVRETDLDAMATEYNRVICPHCRSHISPRQKQGLNKTGIWLPEGQTLTSSGERIGKAVESTIAGYWIGGVAAAYQSWRSIILGYLQALRSYALTGMDETLRTKTNVDQGMPYMSRALREAAAGNRDPASRKEAGLQRFMVPAEARFLVASVDVQGGISARFVVQVHAVGPKREKWVIDRYSITESNRPGVDGQPAPIDPSGYAEDWDLITERVVRSTYKTPYENIELGVIMTVVDSGGEEGVTERAYAWERRVNREGLGKRIMLIKGVGRKVTGATVPLIKETLVGGRNSREGGDILLFNINTNLLKDMVWAGIRRETHGEGYLHIPGWVTQAWLDELNSEVRNPDGTWTQTRKRNETLDLLAYCEAGCLRLGADRLDWNAPPEWARSITENSMRMSREERREMQANTRVATTPLPPQVAVPQPAAERRSSRSSYLR